MVGGRRRRGIEDKMGDRLIGGEGSCGVSEVKMLT